MAMTADQLPDDPDALKAMVLARDVENARLIQIIRELQRHRFGRRAETLPEDQLLLGLEEAEQIEAAGEEGKEQSDPAGRRNRAAKRRTNRGSLPAHLPRIETIVDIEDHACPCCRNGLHRIGEDVSERLDIVPAQLRVIVVRRPKYACRACEDVVVQAPAPARLIEGGLTAHQLGRVREMIESRFAERLTLQDFSTELGMSADHFGRLFKRASGVPVHQFLLRSRIDRVRSFLAETTTPIPERPSKLDPFADKLRAWLKTEAGKSRKQRRTLKQVHADLVALGFTGSYGRVAAFAREWRADRQREQQTAGRGIFVPLSFRPGEAFQFDWSEDYAVIGGERVKLSFFRSAKLH